MTQPQVAIHERARIRSYFAEGVTRYRVPVTVEAIPALLHISIFLFLAGLVVSLFTIHHTIAYVVLAATAVFSLVYAAITVMPVICHDSSYTSPFSAPVWYLSRKTALAVVNTVDRAMDFLGKCSNFVYSRKSRTMREKVPSNLFSHDMTEAAHNAAKRAKTQLDARALGWTLDVGVTIGARCVATVIASQLPDKQMQPTLMRHLKIEEPHMESLDSALLKNLNKFLEDAALKFIDMEDFSVIRRTSCLVKRLELKHAAQELQDEFNKLLNRIYELAEQSSER